MKNAGKCRSLFFSLLGGTGTGALTYFLAQTDIASFCEFLCLMFFLFMFSVPIWCGKSEEFPHFCFSMQKRMFESIMVAAAMLFIFLLIDIFVSLYSATIKNISNTLVWQDRLLYWQIVFPLVTTLFCPLFTLYSVRKDSFRENRSIREVNRPHNVSEPFERFVEGAFVYFMEFFAVCITIFYGKALLDVLTAIVSPNFLDWGSSLMVLFLFFSSAITYFVANSPVVQNNYPKLKTLQLFRKCFPLAWLVFAALAALKMIGIEIVSCITNRGPAVLLAWATIMSLLIAAKRWLSNGVVSVIFFSVTTCTGTLFYFEKEVNQFETRVFNFLEKEKFLQGGVIHKKPNLSETTSLNLDQSLCWLTLKENEGVLLSRLGVVVTSSDGKKYFEMKTPEGTVRKEMDKLHEIWPMFGGDDMKGGYAAQRWSMEVPLRFPFRGIVNRRNSIYSLRP
jgi:hypothetical protein